MVGLKYRRACDRYGILLGLCVDVYIGLYVGIWQREGSIQMCDKLLCYSITVIYNVHVYISTCTGHPMYSYDIAMCAYKLFV